MKGRRKNVSSLKCAFLTGREAVVSYDNSLVVSAGWGLNATLAERRPTALDRRQERFLVPIDEMPDFGDETAQGRKSRSCVRDVEDNTTMLECIWNKDSRKILIDWNDQCPADWGSKVLVSIHGYRYQEGWDITHRRDNNAKLSSSRAGFGSVRIVALLQLTFTHGPWGQGANFGKVKCAAEQYFKSFDWRDELYQAVYPMIAVARNGGARPHALGSEDHMKLVFEMLPQAEILTHLRELTKGGRWHNITNRIPTLVFEGPVLLLILLYIGVSEGLWPNVRASPLYGGPVKLKAGDDGIPPAAGGRLIYYNPPIFLPSIPIFISHRPPSSHHRLSGLHGRKASLLSAVSEGGTLHAFV